MKTREGLTKVSRLKGEGEKRSLAGCCCMVAVAGLAASESEDEMQRALALYVVVSQRSVILQLWGRDKQGGLCQHVGNSVQPR